MATMNLRDRARTYRHTLRDQEKSSMDIRPKVAILTVMLTAFVASPWAAYELQRSTLIPAPVNQAPAEPEPAVIPTAVAEPVDPVVTADEAIVTTDGQA